MLDEIYQNSSNKVNTKESVERLHAAGAHFVLCRGGKDPKEYKKPCWDKWQLRVPALDVALSHLGRGPLAVIPWSLKASGLDVDHGNPHDLINTFPPLADCPTRRKGGHHLYYEDNQARGNGRFAAYGCKGEIRGASGYLILWAGAAVVLADALENPNKAARFPASLFEAAGEPEPARAFKADLHTWTARGELLELETVHPGARNTSLFNAVRFWAYRQSKGQDLEAWLNRVQAFALEQNRRFPIPLEVNEVCSTAYSISTWAWSGGGPIDHSPAAQRRRGVKSGKVRRRAVADRDRAIVAGVLAGESMRAVGGRYGLDHEAVRHIVMRDASLFKPTTLEGARPWDIEGISRRTWFRRGTNGERT